MIQIDMQMPSNCYDCWLRKNLGCRIANNNGWLNIKRDDNCPLQAQEPRVMTLEEVKALKEHKSHAWVEWREEHEQTIVACLPVYCHSGNFYCNDNAIDFEVPFDTFSFAWNEYLTCWRCWTLRPTDAQREATSWND